MIKQFLRKWLGIGDQMPTPVFLEPAEPEEVIERPRKPGKPRLPSGPGMLAEVPAILQTDGRVVGFEHMRDRMLGDWEKFIAAGVNAYSALKLVIELDRHAMFAEVQAAKQQGKFDMKLYEEFQEYLHGAPSADPVVTIPTENAELMSIKSFQDTDDEESDGEDE